MTRYAILVGFIFLFSSSLLHGQPWESRGELGHGRKSPAKRDFFMELKLTDAQEKQFEELRFSQQRKRIDTRAKLQQKRVDMLQLMGASKPDRSAIEKGLKAVSDMQYQQKLDGIAHWFAVNEILTPEQQKIWKNHPGQMGRNMPGTRRMMRMKGHMRENEEDEDRD